MCCIRNLANTEFRLVFGDELSNVISLYVVLNSKATENSLHAVWPVTFNVVVALAYLPEAQYANELSERPRFLMRLVALKALTLGACMKITGRLCKRHIFYMLISGLYALKVQL